MKVPDGLSGFHTVPRSGDFVIVTAAAECAARKNAAKKPATNKNRIRIATASLPAGPSPDGAPEKAIRNKWAKPEILRLPWQAGADM
jgi:hypothetical protein